jgi:hypothetical protein
LRTSNAASVALLTAALAFLPGSAVAQPLPLGGEQRLQAISRHDELLVCPRVAGRADGAAVVAWGRVDNISRWELLASALLPDGDWTAPRWIDGPVRERHRRSDHGPPLRSGLAARRPEPTP